MRDAFGGIVNISVIVVFLVFVSAYLAFNVTYTKAFRLKNKIISTIEQYEGNCDAKNDQCRIIIDEYAKSIGYVGGELSNVGTDVCNEIANTDGYYIEQCPATNEKGINDNNKYYYKVVTAIKIEIPIINNIMEGLDVFRVSGNTKLIRDTNA